MRPGRIGGFTMAATFVDAIVMLWWPLVLSAAAWFIASKALAEKDTISQVVANLTEANGVGKIAKPVDVAPHCRASNPAANGEVDWFPVQASARTALSVLIVSVLIAAASPAAFAGRFEFDSRRTEVRFVYKMAYSTQRGRFTKVSGTLDYDDAAPEKTRVSASIAAASLTTGEAIVDSELKGAAFFNVVASPTIAFKSLSVKPQSATAADVAGEITVNGITKPVTLKVSLKPHNDPARKHDAGAREFIATTRIQRSAFNMTDYQSMVDDEIDIEIAAIVRPR